MGHWMTDVNGDDHYVEDVNGDECYINPEGANAIWESDIFDWMENHKDAMIKHGWYRAVDRNKKSICIGDKVDSDRYQSGIVTGIRFDALFDGDIRTLIAVQPSGWSVSMWGAPDEYYLHKPITVEDVLHDFICDHEEGIRDEADIIAQYAKKLQLAGDVK